jgi:hypothetical protein
MKEEGALACVSERPFALLSFSDFAYTAGRSRPRKMPCTCTS